MWPRSSRFDAQVACSTGIELHVEAWRGGIRLSNNVPIEPSNPQITCDGGSQVRRTCSFTIADANARPVYWTDMLAPAGTELIVTSGVRYPDGQTELLPVGVFRVDEAATPFGDVVSVTGSDRTIVLIEDLFLGTSQSVTTNSITQEIERLIKYSLPTATVQDLTGDFTDCPRLTWEQGSTIWSAIDELATSIGAEVAPNGAGIFVIRKQPKITNPRVWTAAVGESGIIIGGLERMSRDQVFNCIIARNDPADGSVPIQQIVKDTAGGSPTNWNGAFGHRPKVYSSKALNTVSKANTAAQAMLERSIAPARTVTAYVIPHPAVDYGDVTDLVLPDGTTETHMVHKFTLPLGEDETGMPVEFITSIPAD